MQGRTQIAVCSKAFHIRANAVKPLTAGLFFSVARRLKPAVMLLLQAGLQRLELALQSLPATVYALPAPPSGAVECCCTGFFRPQYVAYDVVIHGLADAICDNE